MIFLHCLYVIYAFDYDISLFFERGLGQLLGGPFAAPVFMFAMGVGIVYSRNQEPIYLIKRGFKLMLLGVVVNVGEIILPHFLAGALLGKWDSFPIAGGLLLFCVDILAFAGMAMILIGVLKKLNVSSRTMVIIGLVMSVIGAIVRFHDFGRPVLNLIAGYFIGSAGGFTAFPLFNWFIFPATGIVFGEYYIRCSDKKKLLRLWPLALVISVAYFVISWYLPKGFMSEVHLYWFMTPIDVVFCLICIYGVIGMCLLISSAMSDSVKKFISKTSSNLNTIYVIQWYLIPLTFIFICYFNRDVVFGDLYLVVVGFLEVIASTALAAGYKNFMKSRKGK